MGRLCSFCPSVGRLLIRLCGGLLILALMILSVGTTHAGEPVKVAPPAEIGGRARMIFPEGYQYRVGIEDVLFISVWRDADLTKEVPVRPDGRISLPLINDVLAAGLTTEELGTAIEERLKEFLTNPSVTVIVREVNSLKVYLLGEVTNPGPITLRSETRLLQAISIAGGVTPFGGRNGVLIYRKEPLGEKVIKVSYKDIVKGKSPEDNIVLEAGDTIVVH